MKKRELLLPVGMTAAVLAAVFIAFQLFPAGAFTLSWCDMQQQVVPLLLDFKDILAGKGGFLLNMQNAGGMSFIGVFFFFLSSPLHLLVALVPKAGMTVFMNLLVALKVILCSFTAYLLFRRQFSNLGVGICAAFSAMYAFSGFNLLFYQNVVWLDTAYLFPLLLLGLDRLLKEKKPGLYIAVLCAELAVNYYMSYMVVVFLLLATGLYLLLCCDRRQRREGGLLFLLASLTSAVLTAVVWLPCFLQYLGSARTGSLIQNLMASPVVGPVETTLPLLLCSGIFAAALVFFPYRRLKENHKLIFLLLMTVLLILPLVLEPANKMWHTGSYQCFPARYGYMTTLFVLLMAAAGLSCPGKKPALKSGTKAGLLLGIASVVGLAAFLFPYLKSHRAQMKAYTSTLWGSSDSLRALLYAFFFVALAYVFCLLLYRVRKLSHRGITVILCLLFAVEGFFNAGVYLGYPAHDASSYEDIADLSEKIESTDFYRVKMQGTEFDANWMGAAGYNSLSHYTSLTARDYLFTMKKLGYSSYWMEADSQGGTAFTDALFSNRYIVSQTGRPGAAGQRVYANEHYEIYENRFRLPSALVFPAVKEQLASLSTGNRFLAQESLFQTAFGSGAKLFTLYSPASLDNVTMDEQNGVTRLWSETSGESSFITYTIPVQGTQILYLDCFGGSYSTALKESVNDGLRVYVNGKELVSSYPRQKQNGILELGSFTDQTVEITLELRHIIQAASFGVAGLHTNVLEEAAGRAQDAEIQVSGSSIRTVVQASAGQTLFLPVPFQKGYTVAVNGAAVPAEQVLNTFLGVSLQEGKNTVELHFTPPGLTAGAVISGFGILLLLLLFWLLRKGALSPKSRNADGALWAVAGYLPVLAAAAMLFLIYLLPTALSVLNHMW